MNDSLRIAKINARAMREKAELELMREIVKNPVIELIGAFVIVETLQRYPASRPIIGNWQGNILEGSIGGIIGIQQLAPSLPYLAQATGDIMGAIGKIAGGAGMAAMV